MTTHIEAIEKAIAEFSKTHKIGKAKVETFVSAVLDSAPKRAGGGGRKASERTVILRDRVLAMKGSGEKLTAKQLAERFQTTPVEAMNLLKWAGAARVGYAEKKAGQRGKVAAVFQL